MSTYHHTPGPWIEDGGSVYTVDGHLPIANMERDTNKAQGIPPAERDQNAKLIAAAPELLAALEALLESGEKTNRAFYVDGKKSALLTAFEGQTVLLQNARDAIRKAQGD